MTERIPAGDGRIEPGQCVVVLGFGRSGAGAARLLLERKARVRALELQVQPAMRADWEEMASRGAEMIAGPHPEEVLDGCALVIRSPGVPADVPLLVAARRRGIPILSELGLGAAQVTTPLLTITGTNGKSSTTAWTAHLLRRAGLPAVAAGNIGRSLCRAVLEERPGTVFVVEVSSFQMEDSPNLHPRAAAILNITADHLDRHGSLAAYAAAKWSLARYQEAGDLLVLGPDLEPPADLQPRARIVRCALADPGTAQALFVRDGQLIRRLGSEERALLPADELALPGPHNLLNGMAALALGSALVPADERLLSGLRDFPGLPHRLELAGQIGGVRFVNDSKATNVESQRVALESFPEPIVLLAGGLDKEGPFESLRPLVEARVRHLIVFGRAAARIRAAWPDVPAETVDNLEAAVRRAHAVAEAGEVILLSPGCASFDMFRDYEERGDHFKEIVSRLAEEERGATPRGEGEGR